MKQGLKRSLSMLLVLCMLIGYMPLAASAAEPETTAAAQKDDFYRIVHLDAGRKYFSLENLKKLVDIMAQNGLNQLELYLADNQGFRLALDDTTFTTTTGKQYNLTTSLGNGYSDGTFKPSKEEPGYLNQSEMTELVRYAHANGVEIVPCINVPGHMGAILNPELTDRYAVPTADPYKDLRYTTSDGKISNSSIDLKKPEAVAFALGLTKKYAEYFKSVGCKYYSVGADEYASDVRGDDISWVKGELMSEFIQFLNQAADIIIQAGMTPRAFNDVFGMDDNNQINSAYEVYYWNGSGINAPGLKNHRIINTTSKIY